MEWYRWYCNLLDIVTVCYEIFLEVLDLQTFHHTKLTKLLEPSTKPLEPPT